MSRVQDRPLYAAATRGARQGDVSLRVHGTRDQTPEEPSEAADLSRAGSFSAASPIRRIMPPKMKKWKGADAYQYAMPSKPTGSKIAVWRMIDPSPSGSTSNSNHALPDTCSSAERRSLRFGS